MRADGRRPLPRAGGDQLRLAAERPESARRGPQGAQAAVRSAQAGARRRQAAARRHRHRDRRDRSASLAQAQADLRTAAARSRLHRDPLADRRLCRRPRRADRRLCRPSARHLLSIVPAHGLWVDANFKEDQLARMRAGRDGDDSSPTCCPAATFTGRVVSLAPATGAVFSVIPPENATGNFTKIVQRVPVRIALDDGDGTLGLLRPGLSTTVSVDTRAAGSRSDAPMSHRAPPAGRAEHRAVRGDVRRHVHGAARHPDRRLVAAGYRRRAVGGAGRDQLGADRLSDRRDHRDPAVRLADPGVLDALAVRRLGRRVHRHQHAVRHRLEHREHDRVPRACRGCSARR